MTNLRDINVDNYRERLSTKELTIIDNSLNDDHGFDINYTLTLFVFLKKQIKEVKEIKAKRIADY